MSYCLYDFSMNKVAFHNTEQPFNYSASNLSITWQTRSLISCQVGFNSLDMKVTFLMSMRSKTMRYIKNNFEAQ